jgi:hypothetical protein
MVPVLKGPFQANAIMNYLKVKLEPFYLEGKGQIICPVCKVFTSGEEYRIVYYSRTEFKAHYEKRHHHLEGAAYQEYPTRYNTRMYEATQIYALASGYDGKGVVDQRNANPSKDGKCTHHEVQYSSHLRELLLRNGTILPTLTLKVPAAAKGEPEVVELDDDEERTKPEASGSSRRQGSRPPAQARGSSPKRSRSHSSRQEGSRSTKRSESRGPESTTSTSELMETGQPTLSEAEATLDDLS